MLGLGVKKKLKEELERTRLFFQWLAASARERLKPWPNGREKIVFALDNDRLYRDGDNSGRYAYLILNIFSDAGYAVYLHKNIDFATYVGLGKYGRSLYSIKNLKLVRDLPGRTEDMIYAFDDEQDVRGFLQKRWKKLVYVNTMKSPDWVVGERLWIPYFMHIYNYSTGQYKRLGELRKNPRKVRVFFGGNLNPDYYQNPALRRDYGQMTRLEALNSVRHSDCKVVFLESPKGVFSAMDSGLYSDQCVLLNGEGWVVAPRHWLGLVSKSDFFLCLSGTDLPMCHHTIEAMAVGAIPILAYPGWFFPPLRDGVDALVYRDKEELLKKLDEALAMKEDEVRTLRENALRYYDSHLSHESFIRRFESVSGKLMTLMLQPRYVCTEADRLEHPEPKFQELRRKLT